jgi:osmotically-inducible protein OsmY
MNEPGSPAPSEPQSSEQSTRYLVARIRDALAKDSRVNEPELEVAVSGGKVMVTGTVPTESRRTAVSEVVRELAPDMEVRNATEVGPAIGQPRVEAVE